MPRWHAGGVNGPEIRVSFASELGVFVARERRRGPARRVTDGTSSLGHLVESLGVPLTEVGRLLVDGREADAAHVPAAGEFVRVGAVTRPQTVPGAPLRFLLDVHLGTLARRLRLLGVDAAYESADIGDPAPAARSAAERRVLLSRDRGLLKRRERGPAPTSTAAGPTSNCATCWAGSPPRSPRGPGAPRATGRWWRRTRTRYATGWRTAPAAPTTSSPPARPATGSTGAAPTTRGSRRWSPPRRPSSGPRSAEGGRTAVVHRCPASSWSSR
ncbi:protein of unknown function [Streptantibioticus cattleyicolor NRRL 8057 = DSM 46488]|nr:protein of unknown function [Streptantibioticus cattleyicolor NRRL 8057 = DSM 46488]